MSCLFTALSRAHPDAPLFVDNGIDIMTVKEFVRGFMAKLVEHQANTKLRKLSLLCKWILMCKFYTI